MQLLPRLVLGALLAFSACRGSSIDLAQQDYAGLDGALLFGDEENDPCQSPFVATRSYEGHVLPTAASPAFSVASGGASTVAKATTDGQFLRLVSAPTSADALSYQTTTLSHWNGTGDSTIEASLRLAAGGETGTAQTLRFLTGVRDIQLHFRKTGISLQGGSSFPIDTTVFHTYRVVIRSGSQVEVYVDNGPTAVLTRTETVATTTNRLRFGDVTASEFGDVYWDYIRWTNQGAFPPTPAPFVPSTDPTRDPFGNKKLNATTVGGREYASTAWHNCTPRSLRSGVRDPFDADVKARGNGTLALDGRGVATLTGDSPRLYVYDEAGQKPRWNNVEVTYYARRVSETSPLSDVTFRGFTAGARSDHHLQTSELPEPCTHTYYARPKLSGPAQFLKESQHADGYSEPVASRDLGEIPVGQWLGYKFVLRNINDDKFVKLELYRDVTNGLDGGTWEKVTEFVDDGTNMNANIACGAMLNPYSPLLTPGHSVFLRADFMTAEYSRLSIREIDSDPEQGKPCVPCPEGVSVAPYTQMSLSFSARRTYSPALATTAEQCSCLVRKFTIPTEIAVTEGNGGKHHTDLTFRDGETGATTVCKYTGGSSKMHPTEASDVEAGLRYLFSECDNGQTAGDTGRASYFHLAVHGGDQKRDATAVSLDLALTR